LAVDAETALRDSNAKFENRFRHLESIARTEDKQIGEMDLEQLDQIWRRVKAAE
jgi:ATP diphosphatase